MRLTLLGAGGSIDPMAAKRTGKAKKALNFEQALARLEATVERLEEGELDLDKALGAFEEGVGLSRQCAEYLREAERKIELLTREGDELHTSPFAVEEEVLDGEEG